MGGSVVIGNWFFLQNASKLDDLMTVKILSLVDRSFISSNNSTKVGLELYASNSSIFILHLIL